MATAAAFTSNHSNSDVTKSRSIQPVANGIIADQSSTQQQHHHQMTSAPENRSNEMKQATTPSPEKHSRQVKNEVDDEDDVPLLLRKRKADNNPAHENGHTSSSKATASNLKKEKSPDKSTPPVKTKIQRPTVVESDDEDNKPLSARASKLKTPASKSGSDSTAKKEEKKDHKEKVKHEEKHEHKEKKRKKRDEDDDEDFTPEKKKPKKEEPSSWKKSDKSDKKKDKHKDKTKAANQPSTSGSPPKKRAKKEDEEHEVWRWWEESKQGEGIKWKFLEHKGPVFAPPYDPLPSNVKFFYDGKEMKLSLETEEVATFYSKMLDHEYSTKDTFNKNFFKDWRKVMTLKEREVITDLSKCDFRQMQEYFKKLSEERKNMSKEEKQKLKEEKDKAQKEYGVAVIDGHKEKIGNFRIEPPGLFRGRGTHPKMGMLKKRVMPEDVIINCSKDSKVPQPPPGHKWKEVRHDNTVTWLASWTENIMGNIKYVMLNPSSKLKGEKDWQKYEMARKLNKCVDKIRNQYREDWKSKEMKVRQRAVALYFIDKLALRAGNEKEEGETADTVGCCSLRCEHIKLHDELDGQECVVEFDFLGKDSIRYYNRVPVEKRVFKNLKLFMENKDPGDDLFDRLNTTILNKHLQTLMDGLTAKVFRTYNASHTLQEQLALLTNDSMNVAEKMLAYNRANRQVAILCNHQRAVPKAHGKQMENLQSKIKEKEDALKAAKKELKAAKSDYKAHKNEKNKKELEKKQRAYDRVEEQLNKLKLRATDKEENKEIALSTSKLNYLDPRISVAWCKKFNVPIEKIYNKTQREKFRWAIDMAGPDFIF